MSLPDTANPDDPNEISFTKGEILDIVDKQGKWWQAKKADGTSGSMWLFTVRSTTPLIAFRSCTIQLSSRHLKRLVMLRSTACKFVLTSRS